MFLTLYRTRKEELHSSAVACVEYSVRCCCCALLLPGIGYHFLTSLQARSASVNSSAALHFWYSRKNAAVKIGINIITKIMCNILNVDCENCYVFELIPKESDHLYLCNSKCTFVFGSNYAVIDRIKNLLCERKYF